MGGPPAASESRWARELPREIRVEPQSPRGSAAAGRSGASSGPPFGRQHMRHTRASAAQVRVSRTRVRRPRKCASAVHAHVGRAHKCRSSQNVSASGASPAHVSRGAGRGVVAEFTASVAAPAHVHQETPGKGPRQRADQKGREETLSAAGPFARPERSLSPGPPTAAQKQRAQAPAAGPARARCPLATDDGRLQGVPAVRGRVMTRPPPARHGLPAGPGPQASRGSGEGRA